MSDWRTPHADGDGRIWRRAVWDEHASCGLVWRRRARGLVLSRVRKPDGTIRFQVDRYKNISRLKMLKIDPPQISRECQ